MDFGKFKRAIAAQFAEMAKGELFVTGIDKDTLWSTYLSSFPEGSNPVFRTNTEHDCSCCRSFIKTVGNVVAIRNNKLVSLWDIKADKVDPAYAKVAAAMSTLVKSSVIQGVFAHTESSVGADRNFENTLGQVKTWEHFHLNIPHGFVKTSKEIGPYVGESNNLKGVFARGLSDFSEEVLGIVLELIAQNSLYRGAEHQNSIAQFRKCVKEFHQIPEEDRDAYIWSKLRTVPYQVAGIRNTSIGQLLQKLAEGVDIESAVNFFEKSVAGESYKRPTALVTPSMVAKAKEAVEALGLTSSLGRRYATLGDISVNNVLYVDRSSRKAMADASDVFAQLASTQSVSKPKGLDKVEEVSIEKFLRDVLPHAKALEVMMENIHQANLVSLVTADDPTSAQMFKWPNSFSWSYNGDLADSSMRRAVVERGGSVTGAFRFTHSWNYGKRNASLMDLHVFMPGHKGQDVASEQGRECHDQYGNDERVGWNRRTHTKSGGTQDVDYTQAAPEGYVPVENITFPELSRMRDGVYTCRIHNWNLRSPTQGGFKAEIEFNGQVFAYEYDKPLGHKEWVTVAEVTLKGGKFEIEHHLPPATHTSKEIWGIKTLGWSKVSAVMLSPNFWDGNAIGNQHFFFMLENCINPGTARGFYNEFLRSDLDAHRKVLELVGSKMRAEECPDQLSGLGFSSTQRNSLICKVTGNFTRVVKIVF